MTESNPAYSEAKMLIRKSAAEVFEAMTNPQITTNFWFTKSSGRLTGKTMVTWEWEMYNASANVYVKEITLNETLTFEWGNPGRTVEFRFESFNADSTYVTVKEYGYHETGDALLAVIRDSTGGFTTLLDGMKAFLEHGIRLNLVLDKFPSGK